MNKPSEKLIQRKLLHIAEADSAEFALGQMISAIITAKEKGMGLLELLSEAERILSSIHEVQKNLKEWESKNKINLRDIYMETMMTDK